MALYIIVCLLQYLLHGETTFGSRLEDGCAGLRAEGGAEGSCSSAVREGSLAAGCCALSRASVCAGSFAEDEEFDEDEEDQGKSELAEEES